MRNGSKPKRIATASDVVRLAKKVKWRDIKLPSGEVVSAETTRQIFAEAEKALKRESRRKHAHAVAA
jgi:hypothetical protein